MTFFRRFSLILFSSLALLCGSATAQSLQERLDARPAFPQVSWAQELDESPAQRHARLSVWVAEHEEWVMKMAEFQKLPVSGVATASLPGRSAPHWSIVDFTPLGDPVFDSTFNTEAAVSTHARTLRDGLAGLDGANEIAAVWDGGAIRDTHIEFQIEGNLSRVTRRETGMTLSSHATHVGGTIAAAGVDIAATGMAPAARLDSWTKEQFTIEMIEADPIDSKSFRNVCNNETDFMRPSLSNHSYGLIPTWNWDVDDLGTWVWPAPLTIDLHPTNAAYDSAAELIDSNAFAMPAHLAVRSAGNARSDGPQPGDTFHFRANTRTGWNSAVYDPTIHPATNGDAAQGYFTISPSAVGKNILTVGAHLPAQNGAAPLRSPERAVPSGFTSWGPTRCGRIKPDLVANGTDLYSSDSRANAAYGEKSGTSMSAPAVTGTALLLQQFHRSLGSNPRRLDAAEMKGLLIHTCDDIDMPGPDYRTGFGLMNAVAAKHVLLRARNGNPAFLGVIGNVATNGGPTASANHSVSVELFSPTALKATLVWIDPPGKAQDTKSHGITLVNDLDLRIIDSNGNTHLPFVLDPANPAQPASTGDNVFDNVEQVIFPNVQDGTYTIEVTCKPNGTAGSQRYALWVSPITDRLAVEQLAISIPASGAAVPLSILTGQSTTLLPGASWVVPQNPTATGERVAQVGAQWNISSMPRESTVLVRAANESGEIEVRVTQAGAVSSSSIPLPTGLGEPTLAFTSTASAAWEGVRNFLSQPGDVAISPLIGDKEATWVRHEFVGPGAVTFDHLVSSETNADYFSFNSIVGGIENTHLLRSGIHDWTPFTITFDQFAAPQRTLEWRYHKNVAATGGNDRVLVRNLKIHRLLPGTTSLSVNHSGTMSPFTWAMTHPSAWLIRGASPWVLQSATSGNGGGTTQISTLRNFSSGPRNGSFQIGSDFLGFHTISVTQTGSPRIPITDIVQTAGLELITADNGGGWIGVAGAGKDGQDAIGISGHPTGPSAGLRLTRNGPGVLYFHARLDHGEGDIASLEIDGEFTNLNLFPAAEDGWRACAVYLPAASNTLVFRHTHGGDPASPNTSVLSEFEFLPGSYSQSPAILPSSGGAANFTFSGFGAASWEIDPLPADEQPIKLSPITGTVDKMITASIGPDTRRLGAQKALAVSLDGRTPVAIPLNQQRTFLLDVSTGLDLPPGVTASVVSPSPSRVIGQVALAADGLDAAVLGHHIGEPESLTLHFTGPALLTLDYRYTNGVSPASGFNAHLNNTLIGDAVFPSGTWNTLPVFHNFAGTHELRFSKKSPDARYLYLDRVRIEPIPASWQGETRIVDAAAGRIFLPMYGTGGSSITVSDPAYLSADFYDDPRTRNLLLRITHGALPAGSGGRVGWVDVAGRRIHIVQLRESALYSGYLGLAGLTDSDQVRHQPVLHPFAPVASGMPRALTHAFALNFPTAAALPGPRFVNGAWHFDIATRSDDLLTRPAIEVSTNLETWHASHLESGEWTQPPGFAIQRRADGNSANSFFQTHGLIIQPTDPSSPRVFIRQAAGFAE